MMFMRADGEGSDTSKNLRIVIFREEGMWVAQGLERDICVQASGLQDVRRLMVLTIALEAERTHGRHGKVFHGIGPAPSSFEEIWNHAATGFMLSGNVNSVKYAMSLCEPVTPYKITGADGEGVTV